MRLPSSSATKRSAEQKADFVSGHKIGKFLQSFIFEDSARVAGRFRKHREGQVAMLGDMRGGRFDENGSFLAVRHTLGIGAGDHGPK
jgi:hypothetical protein